MRTLVLVGIAAVAALAADKAMANPPADNAATTTRSERRVIVVDRVSDGEALVYGDRTMRDSAYRGRWNGEWQGAWEQGATPPRYRGTYQGTYEGAPQGGYRGERAVYSAEDMERMCRRDDGVGGAAIGAVAGGVVGNRVAGRGNRTAGTVVGAAAGAVAGAVIDRAEDTNRMRACEAWWAHSQRGAAYAPPAYGYGYDAPGYDGYATQSGYWVAGTPVVVEETETTYETVAVAAPVRARVAPRPRARVVHRVAPRPRPVCGCR
jgi:hypothetical protein